MCEEFDELNMKKVILDTWRAKLSFPFNHNDMEELEKIIDYYEEENQKLEQEKEELLKEKQELIDYLKDLIENRFTNSKVVWFDSEYARDFGELCSMAGAGDTRLALVPLSEIENILSKIEKR